MTSQQDKSLSDDDLNRLFRQLTEGGRRSDDAVSALYRHFRKPILGHLCRNGLDAGTAEDVLQNAFIKLMQRARQWRGEGSPNAWFWVIVRNTMIDHYRALKGEVTMGGEDWETLIERMPGPEARPDVSGELQRCVQLSFQRFAKAHPERAEAIRLMHFEGWTIAQVAQALERTPGAMKEFLSQCRKTFKSFVEPCFVWLKP